MTPGDLFRALCPITYDVMFSDLHLLAPWRSNAPRYRPALGVTASLRLDLNIILAAGYTRS
jgi:hypothetical protein